MFERFEQRRIDIGRGVIINARIGGSGQPLLLLHGHPQSHVMWHRVADQLAESFTVVCADLRGYGDSSRVPAVPDCAAYSKRTMAADMVALMKHLGFDQFKVGAHDRGARVAHRMALDHGERIERMLLLDIAPTLAMYEGATQSFARAYWHWFFLIQPASLPERLIDADPVAYLHDVMGRRHAGLAAFSPQALAEYERCIAIPGSAGSICSDYRASAGVDLDHDRADRDAGSRVEMPVRVLWGALGAVGQCFDVLALWRDAAANVSGHALDCGHYLAEERPDEVVAEMREFFIMSSG